MDSKNFKDLKVTEVEVLPLDLNTKLKELHSALVSSDTKQFQILYFDHSLHFSIPLQLLKFKDFKEFVKYIDYLTPENKKKVFLLQYSIHIRAIEQKLVLISNDTRTIKSVQESVEESESKKRVRLILHNFNKTTLDTIEEYIKQVGEICKTNTEGN